MSSNPPNNPANDPPPVRVTGAKTIFLNRVKQAAAQKLATASQHRSTTIGAANSQAASVVDAAHRAAANVLSPHLAGAYALTDQGLYHSDFEGKCDAPLAIAGGSSGFVINLGAQQVFWSELHEAPGKGSADCPKQDQVTFYPQPEFQGEPHTVVAPMTADQDYTILNTAQLDFLPAGFSVGSIRIGPGTALTLFEKTEQWVGALGRTQLFTADVPNLEMDWPVGPETSYAVSHSYHALMKANLDGTNPTRLASLPEINPRNKKSGAVALDAGRGLLFWITPTGHIMQVDLAVADTVVIGLLRGIPAGLVGIAVDTVNQNVYWSVVEIFGTLPYGGGQLITLVVNPTTTALPMGPFGYPNDFFTFGKPAIRIAVDAPNGRMYCSNGQEIWRAHLDGTGFFINHPTPNKIEIERLYTLWDSAWGLSLDQAAQMLYWISGSGDLMRMHVDPSLNQGQLMQSSEKVCTFQGLAGHPVDLALFPSADLGAAKQLVDEAHARRQAAQTRATDSVNKAHTDAAVTRQKAQSGLDQAHTDAANNISTTQLAAANSRQQAQADAQVKQKQAAERVQNANEDADRARSKAQSDADSHIAQKQTEADGIKATAQAHLDDQRRKLQNT